MPADTSPIVTYNNPPLDEVAIAVQFVELPGVTQVQFSDICRQLIKPGDTLEDHPPLVEQSEFFDTPDGQIVLPNFSFQNMTLPQIRRTWIVRPGGQDLMQLQTTRFVNNWRRLSKDAQAYPRFQIILPSFISGFEAFKKAVNATLGIDPNVSQVDVSYFNFIDVMDGETFVSTTERYFSCLKVPEITEDKGMSAVPEHSQVHLKYVLQSDEPVQQRARLHIDLAPALKPDGRKTIRYQMTARGLPNRTDTDGISNFVSFCRRGIVGAFDSLASETARQEWQRESVNGV